MALNSSRYPYEWTPEEAAFNFCLAPDHLSEVGERGLLHLSQLLKMCPV